jgi:NAD(P)-dependent dehydrogenase (short-subunit alcohol dehydrogenase family)/uncharacterized OB-fold protein
MTELSAMLLPPKVRSRAALGLTAAAAVGRFELQVCRLCGAVQYPSREACHRCLASLLDWKLQDGSGELIAETTLLHSHDAFFRERLPIRLGLVRLSSGPTAVVYLHSEVSPAPARVTVGLRLDKAGQAVLVALPEGGITKVVDAHMTDNRHLQEMSCDPRGRRVLVTDAGSAVGVALVRALVDAGAEVVWAGQRTGAADAGGRADLLGTFKQVRLLSLDVTSDASVGSMAGELGALVDIVINNAEAREVPASGAVGLGSQSGGTGSARAEMDIHYFGLLRLAQALGSTMRSRALAPGSTVTAWVNVLSIYALSSFPKQSTLSAAQAAAYSLSQALRAQMLPAGIRVVNVFPGPVDDEGGQAAPPPKIAPVTLARAIVKALQDGIEDVYPGEVAQEWFARWRENPKVLEREVAAL